MPNNSLKKIINLIFFPALFLSLLLSSSGILFNFSQKTLINNQIGFDLNPALKGLTILAQIILAISLLLFSIYKPFEKVFKGTLITLTSIIALLTGLIFFQEHLILSEVSETLGIYKYVVTYWPISLMYIVLSLLNFNLYSLFIWGFINRVTTLNEGTKYYIPVAFILGIAGTVISNFGLIVIGVCNYSLMTTLITAIILMICSIFVFNLSWKRFPNNLIHPEDESSISHSRFPFLSSAYLLAGCFMIKNFLDIFFKSQLKTQFPDPASYSKLMSYYSISLGSTTIAISVIWAVLGTWLILKKRWKITALYASVSILLGGITFLSLSPTSLNQGIFSGLLISTTNIIFFSLIQILYLHISSQNRFKTKIITEIIALPLMKEIPSLTIQGLLIIFGSITAIHLYIKIIVLVLMLLLIIASRVAASSFSTTKTKA